MMEETLFSNNVKRPLADRLRPQSLKEVVGRNILSAMMRRWDE